MVNPDISMNRLFPLPIYSFFKIVVESGGIAPKRIKNIAPWLIKTIVFEPLRWVELILYNKKIRQHRIEKHPVFILGFYRSGTSYLHQIMTKDDRLGYHSNFQMVAPEIMLCSEKVLLPLFEWICRTFKLYDAVHRTPLSFRFPGEEDATMTTYVSRRGAQLGYFFPKKMREWFQKYVLFEGIPEEEKEAWKQEFVFLLKKISIANGGKQLVLKSPPHTARIQLLLSLFPNAKFIFIHRNPYEVYISNKRFWNVVQRVYSLGGSRSVDLHSIILDTYSKMMERYLQEKDLIPEGQLVEIPYEDFVQAPFESMQKIYQTIRLNDFIYCEKAIHAFVGQQKDFVRLEHQLPEDEQKTVSEKLEPFIRQWNYPLFGATREKK